jgi:integrase
VLIRAVERANENIVSASGDPRAWEESLLPERISPHALRRSFASWLVAEGEDPAYVMQQLGHSDPKMTLGLYARALTSKRRRACRALSGTGDALGAGDVPEEVAA